MKILAIDTTAKTASVALGEIADGAAVSSAADVRVIAEYTVETGTHSSSLLPMAESVLALTGNRVSDIGLFAVSTGPGSFTGIRIGVSAVKGLAFAGSTPCVGVSSLDALAWGAAAFCGIIAPAIDSRRESVYTALYLSDGRGGLEKLTDDCQLLFTELLDALEEKYPAAAVCMPGDAYKMYSERYSDRMKNIAPHHERAGAGGVIAAAVKWSAAEDRSCFTDSALSPVYLKKAQAEREREEAQKEKSNSETMAK